MEKVYLICLALLNIFHLSSVYANQWSGCQNVTLYSGAISVSLHNSKRCWFIDVPEDSYVRLHLREANFWRIACDNTYLKYEVAGTEQKDTLCYSDGGWQPIFAFNDVKITFAQYYGGSNWAVTVKLLYNIESVICTRKNNFRCSTHSCIHQDQVCDGVKNCQNGADELGCETGVAAMKGVNVSRINAVTWLKKQRTTSYGWGKNTHRAIAALYLTGNASFREGNLEEDLMAKQLELETSLALLRNSSDPLSVGDLSIFINALTVTCHNPRLFYGHDLLQILSERVVAESNLANPAAYLTLCNTNFTFSESHTRHLLKILDKQSEYLFHLDVQALTVMALTCVKKKNGLYNIQNATELYNSAVHNIIAGQLPDGSFGNVYTTAVVTQALLSSGQENNTLWKLRPTMKFLMQEMNSSVAFLSTYFVLPIFNGKSLVDIADVNCTYRKIHEDAISDVTNKLGGKMSIQYSLYIGDQKDLVHTMYLRMPENSSAFDVMRVAQVADPKYKFLHRDVSGNVYVYQMAGLTNDPEVGKFWLLYTENDFETLKHHTKSPEKVFVGQEKHLIMWYRTASEYM